MEWFTFAAELCILVPMEIEAVIPDDILADDLCHPPPFSMLKIADFFGATES